jgi:hypothetical protein
VVVGDYTRERSRRSHFCGSPAKELNAGGATTIASDFLKRIGYKCGLKPKRVSLEGDLHTVEVELKKFTASEGSHADDCYLWCGYCRQLLRLEDTWHVTLFTSDLEKGTLRF